MIYLFSSSLKPASGHEENTLRVRFPFKLKSGSRGGKAAVDMVEEEREGKRPSSWSSALSSVTLTPVRVIGQA